MDDDGFAIDSRDGSIVIASAAPRGVLFGTYTLLRAFGARFYAPAYPFYKGRNEFIPRLAVLSYPRLLEVENPSFRYRRKYISEGTSHSLSTVKALLDWMAKNNLNTLVYPANLDGANFVTWDTWRSELTPELSRRDLILEVGGHGYETFLAPARYQSAHQDWFGGPSEPIVGSGIPPANVFRISNADALHTYESNVQQYLAQRPEIQVFDAWPPDATKWIQSDVDAFGGVPQAMAHVSCNLEARLQQNGSNVRVESLGYLLSLNPPKDDDCYSANSVFDIAPYDRSYATSIGEDTDPINRQYALIVRNWADSGFPGTLGIFEYYRKYSWHSLPVFLPDLMGQDHDYYYSHGVRGIGFQSEPADWITYELTHLLGARLSWDATTDTQTYVNDYLQSRYGVAATSMHQYLDQVSAAGRILFDGPQGRFDDAATLEQAEEHYQSAKEAITQALAAVPQDARNLVTVLAANVDYALLDIRLSRDTLSGDSSLIAKDSAALHDEIESHKFDGAILKNYYSIKRYDPAITYEDTYPLYEVYRNAFR